MSEFSFTQNHLENCVLLMRAFSLLRLLKCPCLLAFRVKLTPTDALNIQSQGSRVIPVPYERNRSTPTGRKVNDSLAPPGEPLPSWATPTKVKVETIHVQLNDGANFLLAPCDYNLSNGRRYSIGAKPKKESHVEVSCVRFTEKELTMFSLYSARWGSWEIRRWQW